MRHASAVQAQPVTNAFTLGRASSLSDPVARGEVGEIRRLELETDRGTFAIKQEFKSSSVDEVETSTAYQRACWEAGIPTPEPLRALTGGFTAQVDGRQVRLTSTPPGGAPLIRVAERSQRSATRLVWRSDPGVQ
jgi:hypothetical protein